ncbi:hypothetical protein WOLCODRAFT_145913 [Wolfiporia cocos MD-104 SS10]|uniref:Uncharacterized protein n=1 Tax=Wolfiporia cocos (strain MD-104) TaxID=742152 RepID=A0A2H3J0A7_WOLCO|nr:hypothetical protein WOLCODRAFT_145913 [Wolfiporia cocos MD-104 SS10]
MPAMVFKPGQAIYQRLNYVLPQAPAELPLRSPLRAASRDSGRFLRKRSVKEIDCIRCNIDGSVGPIPPWWNWCPFVFIEGQELLKHLESEHFNNILCVDNSTWELQQRAYESQSGVVDSLLRKNATNTVADAQSLPRDTALLDDLHERHPGNSVRGPGISRSSQPVEARSHASISQGVESPEITTTIQSQPLHALSPEQEATPQLPPESSPSHSSVRSQATNARSRTASRLDLGPNPSDVAYSRKPPSLVPQRTASQSQKTQRIASPFTFLNASSSHASESPTPGQPATQPPSSRAGSSSPAASPQRLPTDSLPTSPQPPATPSASVSRRPFASQSKPSIYQSHPRPSQSSLPATQANPRTPPSRRKRPFASCVTQSSPIRTPLASPLPPTPPLSTLIADAINAASTLNAARAHPAFSPRTRPPRARPPALGSASGSVSPDARARRRAAARLPHRPSAEDADMSSESGSSAEDVEMQLTQIIDEEPELSPTPPPSRVRAQAREEGGSRPPSHPAPPHLPNYSQALYDSHESVNDGPVSRGVTRSKTSSFKSGRLRIAPEDADAMDVDEGLRSQPDNHRHTFTQS